MKTTITLILILIGMTGMGQGVFNIHFDPSKKDTFYFSNYYHSYCFNYNYIISIPAGVCGIVVGKGDTMQYLFKEKLYPSFFSSETLPNTLITLWSQYKQECFDGDLFRVSDKNTAFEHYLPVGTWVFSAKDIMFYEIIDLPAKSTQCLNSTRYKTVTNPWEKYHNKLTFEGFMEWLKKIKNLR